MGASGSSSEESDLGDESYNVHSRKIRRHAKKRGRGRPPKLKRSQRKSIVSSGPEEYENFLDEEEVDFGGPPKLPKKRGRPRLKPLGVQLDDYGLEQEDQTEKGLFDEVDKRRRRGGRVVDRSI